MLLSVVRKILTTLLTKNITPSMQNYVRDTQSGFRPKHSTADEVFYTRMMCERSLLGDWSYPGASLDFSGAFDTVVRESALERLKESGASTSTVSTLISNTTARIKLHHQLSGRFATNLGVVQGDPLSPPMFITYTEKTMRAIDDAVSAPHGLPSQFTQYADDTMVHDIDPDSASQTVLSYEPIFINDNLKLNVQKTQYFTASKTDDSWKSVKLLGSHLGSVEDVSARMSSADRAFGTVSWKRHTLKSRLAMFSTLTQLWPLDTQQDANI